MCIRDRVVSDGTTSYTLNKSATTSSFAHTLCLTDDCWTITAYDGNSSYLYEYSWDVTIAGSVVASGGVNSSSIGGPSAQFSVGSGFCTIPGCIDSTAINFDPMATVNDSSCLYPPANDDCSGAIAIACGDTLSANTAAASGSGYGYTYTSSWSGTTTNGKDVWYTVVGTGGDFTVSLCNSNFDTYLLSLIHI